MTNILKQYFPMIRTREEIVEQIKASRDLRILFEDWSEKGKTRDKHGFPDSKFHPLLLRLLLIPFLKKYLIRRLCRND